MKTTQVPTNRGVNEDDVVHTRIYTRKRYSAMKKNEILPFAAAWTDLEGPMLSEISQRIHAKARNTKAYDVTHMWNLKRTTKQNSETQRMDRWLLGRGGSVRGG